MIEAPFDLEQEAFRASGIEEFRIPHFTSLLTMLKQTFLARVALSDDLIVKAKQVFDWLWQEKPNRYGLNGHYKLSDVVESQLKKGNQEVGNCLGLTTIYNCLLARLGVHPKVLHLENAFGMGPHVLSVLSRGHSDIHIENILREGFDYKWHLANPTGTKWGDRELVADIYNSHGSELFEEGELNMALLQYDKAISLNPRYEKYQFNRMILLDKLSGNSS